MNGFYEQGQVFHLAHFPVTLHFETDVTVTYTGFRIYFYLDETPPGKLAIIVLMMHPYLKLERFF